MKRFLNLAMVLCLCWLLTLGCSSNTAATTPEASTAAAQLKYFDFNTNDVVVFFNEALPLKGYNKLKKGEVEKKTLPDYGAITCRNYYFSSALYLLLYESKTDRKLMKIILAADEDLLDLETAPEVQLCMGLLLGMIDPDMGEEIKEELMYDFISSGTTSAKGKTGDYIYYNGRGNSTLIITPL